MKYKKKTLKNGLRIITVPMKDNNTVTALVLVEAGAKYEDKKNNGISHFLEHMCFKGTEKRPNSRDIVTELDSSGAKSNAFTGYEYTGYYSKAHSKKVNKLIDVISDMYLNSVFDEKEIEKEKGVIIEELNMIKDQPMQEVQYLLLNVLYGDQPIGRNIVGTEKVIKSVDRDDFLDYRNKHYVASATTVIVAGNINEKEVVKEVERRFENIKTSKKKGKVKVVERQSKPQIKIIKKKSDQTHLALGIRSFPASNKNKSVSGLMSVILGRGLSSRLHYKMRDELGLCYYVYADNDSYTDHGYFSVSAGVDNKKIKNAIEAILEELRLLKEELVSEKELKKAKEYLIGNMFMNLESSDSLVNFFGKQEVSKEGITTPREKAKKIREVSAKDIRRVANKIFTNDRLNLAIVGNVNAKKEKELKKVLKI